MAASRTRHRAKASCLPAAIPVGLACKQNPQCTGVLHLSGLSCFSPLFRKQNRNIQPSLRALRASIERRQHPNIDLLESLARRDGRREPLAMGAEQPGACFAVPPLGRLLQVAPAQQPPLDAVWLGSQPSRI